jgi:hypothetical protein
MSRDKLPTQNVSHKKQTTNATNESAKQSNQTIPVVPNTPVSVHSDRQEVPDHRGITCQIEKDWWDKFKPYVESAGIILLGIYTGYAIKMYCANKKAADAARDSANISKQALTIGQRPWIGLMKEPQITPTSDPQNSGVGLIIKNYGLSPALQIGFHSDLMTMGKDASTVEKQSDLTCKIAEVAVQTSDHVSGNFGFTMFPNDIRTAIDNRPIPNQQTFDVLLGDLPPIFSPGIMRLSPCFVRPAA